MTKTGLAGVASGATRDLRIVEQTVKNRTWFRNVFRKQVEIDADTLMDRVGTSAGKKSAAEEDGGGGAQRWRFDYPDVVNAIKLCCEIPPDHMPLKSLQLSIWCDVPKGFWDKYNRDFQFHTDIETQIHDHMSLMIKEWARMSDASEKRIKAIDLEQKAAVGEFGKAMADFRANSSAVLKEWESSCVDLMTMIFRAKGKTDGDYARYKVKCGAKLVSTVGGIAVSVAGLATAATPAAPATLIPAVLGLVGACTSLIKQVVDLGAEASTVHGKIIAQLDRIQIEWKDKNGVWNKKSMKAKEFAYSIVDSVFGDVPELLGCPTLAGLKDKNTLLAKKTDGLEMRLHTFVMSIVDLEDGLTTFLKANERYQEKMAEASSGRQDSGKTKQLSKKLQQSLQALGEQRALVAQMKREIPERETEIKELRAANEKFQMLLDQAEEALGTKNIKLWVGLVYALGVAGSGYASPPSDLSGTVTASLGSIQVALDLVRENYTTIDDDWGKK